MSTDSILTPETSPTPTVSIFDSVAQVGRRLRSPKHAFQVKHVPWEIQPVLLAPVLPGDTLERADLRVRAVTDPIKNSLIGWWLEHYVFYVPLTALETIMVENAAPDGIGPFRKLMLSSTATLEGLTFSNSAVAASKELYNAGLAGSGGYNFVAACLELITRFYFRDQDETSVPFSGFATGVPMARTRAPGQESWNESLQKEDVEPVPDVVVNPVTGEPDDPYYEMWLRMREMRLTALTYEDWLRDQGIKGVPQRFERTPVPELIRYTRDWALPANTPDATGNVASVVSWSLTEEISKKRFFKEPGFLFGCTLARPKVYLQNQIGPASNYLMDRAFAWMPKALRERPELALRKFTSATGPMAGKTGANGYWLDMVDLFMYGDQFVNFDLTDTASGVVVGPGATLQKADLYPTKLDVQNLFKSTAADFVRTGRTVRQDGAFQFRILSSLRDLT